MGSIPPITIKNNVPHYFKNRDSILDNWPYKVLFSFRERVGKDTLLKHIYEFYQQHLNIPMNRRINLIHVLDKYIIVRHDNPLTATNPDGSTEIIPVNEYGYRWFDTGTDIYAILNTITTLQKYAFIMNHIMWKYSSDWVNRTTEELLKLKKYTGRV